MINLGIKHLVEAEALEEALAGVLVTLMIYSNSFHFREI